MLGFSRLDDEVFVFVDFGWSDGDDFVEVAFQGDCEVRVFFAFGLGLVVVLGVVVIFFVDEEDLVFHGGGDEELAVFSPVSQKVGVPAVFVGQPDFSDPVDPIRWVEQVYDVVFGVAQNGLLGVGYKFDFSQIVAGDLVVKLFGLFDELSVGKMPGQPDGVGL